MPVYPRGRYRSLATMIRALSPPAPRSMNARPPSRSMRPKSSGLARPPNRKEGPPSSSVSGPSPASKSQTVLLLPSI
jgi:hypothetical protein